MHAQAVPIAVISAWLGHADSAFTMRTYVHAQRYANRVEVSKLTGEYVAPSLGKTTVGELGPAWLDRHRGHMKPSGFRSYEDGYG